MPVHGVLPEKNLSASLHHSYPRSVASRTDGFVETFGAPPWHGQETMPQRWETCHNAGAVHNKWGGS